LNWSKIGGFGLVVIDRAELNKARQEGGYWEISRKQQINEVVHAEEA
jgi:hypothetical protein